MNIINRLIQTYTSLHAKKTVQAFMVLAGLFVFTLTPQLLAPADTASQAFKLTDDDLKALGLPETEAEQLKQFVEALNTLSPAQKAQLEEEGRRIEKEMRSKGLDPTNFDDMMKYMEDSGMAPGGAAKPQQPVKRAPEALPIEPIAEKATIVAVASPSSTAAMLDDILKHLSSLRQKAVTRPAIGKKLESLQHELSELAHYIPLLKSQDLIVLLSSKEFVQLHETFEALHKALATFEPSIIAGKSQLFDENDPYDVLGVPYEATKEEIQKRFNELKEQNSPKAIEALLKKEKVPARTIKKQVKRASIAFGSLERAYKILSTPKLRADVDKKLHKKIQKETARERTSMRAFTDLYTQLSSILKSNLLMSIKQLLERYKPQELALARAQMEKERMQYERSKQVVKIPHVPLRETGGFGGPYEEFYRKMAQESYMRPQYPQQRLNGGLGGAPGAQPTGKAGEKAAEGGAGGKGKGKEGGKKEGEKGKEGAKKEEGKGEEKQKEEKRDTARELAIFELAQILEDAAGRKNAIKVGPLVREGPLEGETEEAPQTPRTMTLTEIMHKLNTDLSAGPTVHRTPGARPAAIEPLDSARYLENFWEVNRMNMILDKMKKLAPGPGKKIANEGLKKAWTEQVFKPYGALIQEWHHAIHHELAKPRAQTEYTKIHNLAAPKVAPNIWAKPTKEAQAKPQEGAAAGAADLGKIRHEMDTLYQYFMNINQAFGLGAVPQKTR